MKKPDIPEFEAERLGALLSLGILDTQPDERFDRVTRLAKRIFGVPIALFSLVDENRQWFKSSIGLNVIETPRDISFCGHAIHGSEVFVISDATQDPRFADNPLVTADPCIRFYAGCPLTFNGCRLGTLCIIDNKPRNINLDDIQVLQDLASIVEGELVAVQLATLDELTNMLNRRGFMLLAQHSLSVCKRLKNSSVLIFLDLDEFKHVNDKFGHAVGDQALITFAANMKNAFRGSDVCGRLGGDEFVVLLADTSREIAENIMQRFNDAIIDCNHKEELSCQIAFTYGMVEYSPEKHSSIEDLLLDGDSLMYEIKRKKKLNGLTLK